MARAFVAVKIPSTNVGRGGERKQTSASETGEATRRSIWLVWATQSSIIMLLLGLRTTGVPGKRRFFHNAMTVLSTYAAFCIIATVAIEIS